jgi:neutral ceramidase
LTDRNQREGTMEEFLAGAAAVDITPPSGLAMAGFAARTEPAIGSHDPLTVRAVVVGDTAVVGVDTLTLGRTTTARIRAGAGLSDDAIIVAALHTHGGPDTFLDHPFARPDPGFMARLEEAAIEAVNRAVAARRPARIAVGLGADPEVARNRRHPGGITDPSLPVIAIRTPDGRPIATLVSYACHPVVLGPDNRLWTADYPGVVRAEIERREPGTVALFLTGCTGDANIGHSAHASFSLGANTTRTFDNAGRIGRRIADCALAAPLVGTSGGVAIASRDVTVGFARREKATAAELAATWRRERESAEPGRAALLEGWIRWAEAGLPDRAGGATRSVRVSALRWGGAEIIALPGENFAATAHRIRRAIANPAAMVIAYADDTFGYIPAEEEFAAGGYEVEEAHRYYGMPATVAPGTAEAFADAAVDLIRGLRRGQPAA